MTWSCGNPQPSTHDTTARTKHHSSSATSRPRCCAGWRRGPGPSASTVAASTTPPARNAPARWCTMCPTCPSTRTSSSASHQTPPPQRLPMPLPAVRAPTRLLEEPARPLPDAHPRPRHPGPRPQATTMGTAPLNGAHHSGIVAVRCRRPATRHPRRTLTLYRSRPQRRSARLDQTREGRDRGFPSRGIPCGRRHTQAGTDWLRTSAGHRSGCASRCFKAAVASSRETVP